jgi:eukaryotic-like serine/threonine-protein kinase
VTVTLLADRYELGPQLGAGGMARVVVARDRRLDRDVAVKLLYPSADPAGRARFLGEAKAAARLRHPNLVAVHDTGEDDGQPYIVMELVDGESLGDLLDREGALEVEQAVAITLGVLDALEAAHRQGFVHRDVKPGNVLLPAEGGVKLADFGIAKALDEATVGLTATGAVMGTASYLAPELVEGGAASAASDVYAVGCVLYAMLAGDPPFTGDHALAVAYAHRHAAVPPLERADVPSDLLAIVTRSLAKDPGGRFPDAASMRAALLGEEVVPPTVVAPVVAPSVETARDPTAVLASDGPTLSGDGRRGGTLRAVLGTLAVALVLVLAGWWLFDFLGSDDDLTADAVDPAAPAAPADDPAADAGPADDAGDGEEEPAPDEPAPDEPTDEEPADDPGADEPADEDPADPATAEELIARLSSAPSGTYGEKHDDLLEDLVDWTRETDPEDRRAEAEAILVDVADWVEDGELDPEVGRWVVAILGPEAV